MLPMELDTNVLTLLLVMAFALWKGLGKLDDLRARAARHQRNVITPFIARRLTDRCDAATASVRGRNPSSAVARCLAQVRQADRSFDLTSFLKLSLTRYEIIAAAFAAGDRATLRQLVSPEVHEVFAQAIAQREARRETTELSFVRLEPATVIDAAASEDRILITVRVASEFVTATRDDSGDVVAGNPARIVSACEQWAFAKETSAPDLAWQLVAAAPSPTAADVSGSTEAVAAGNAQEDHDRSCRSDTHRACA